MFKTIIKGSLMPNMTGELYTQILYKKSDKMSTFFSACMEKVNRLQDFEEKFDYFKWGLTRPNDCFCYIKWEQCLYPYNKYSDNLMDWRAKLSSLTKYKK